MAESKVDWSVLDSIKATYVGYVDDEAVIRKDPAKGIPDDVHIPFTKPVWNVSSDVEAADAFEKLGAAAFNGLLNYATDLRRRGTVAQAERARLTADPLKKELKTLAAFDFTEAQQESYVEARRNGMSQKQALASILS